MAAISYTTHIQLADKQILKMAFEDEIHEEASDINGSNNERRREA
jgi:hypothetical protein